MDGPPRPSVCGSFSGCPAWPPRLVCLFTQRRLEGAQSLVAANGPASPCSLRSLLLGPPWDGSDLTGPSFQLLVEEIHRLPCAPLSWLFHFPHVRARGERPCCLLWEPVPSRGPCRLLAAMSSTALEAPPLMSVAGVREGSSEASEQSDRFVTLKSSASSAWVELGQTSTRAGVAGGPCSVGLCVSDQFLQEDRGVQLPVAHGHVWVLGTKSGCVCGGWGSLWPAFPTGLLSLYWRAESEYQRSGANLFSLLGTEWARWTKFLH